MSLALGPRNSVASFLHRSSLDGGKPQNYQADALVEPPLAPALSLLLQVAWQFSAWWGILIVPLLEIKRTNRTTFTWCIPQLCQAQVLRTPLGSLLETFLLHACRRGSLCANTRRGARNTRLCTRRMHSAHTKHWRTQTRVCTHTRMHVPMQTHTIYFPRETAFQVVDTESALN